MFLDMILSDKFVDVILVVLRSLGAESDVSWKNLCVSRLHLGVSSLDVCV